jgi:hypothetical protein
MRIKLIAPFLLCCILSCNKKHTLPSVAKQSIYKDTVLEIDSLNFIDTKGSSTLTEEKANQALDEYYAPKGIHNYETGYQDEDFMQLCAYYDTLYTYNLNKDNHQDGIIKYHLMPCSASGHCYQPTYAIVTRINGRYKLISAEFIPEYFSIDSIISNMDFKYLYFHSFDCSENKELQHYRAQIKTK